MKSSHIVGIVTGTIIALIMLGYGLYLYFQPYSLDEKGCIIGGKFGYKRTSSGQRTNVVDYENCQKPPGIATPILLGLCAAIFGPLLGTMFAALYEKEFEKNK